MASSTILHPGPRDRYLPRFGVFKKRSQADRAMLGQSPMKREHPWQHHRRSVTDSMSPVSSFEAHSALQPKRWTCYLQKPEWPWLGPSGIPSLILCFKVQPPKENLATRDGTSPPLPKHPITAFPAVAETPHEMDGSSDEQELRQKRRRLELDIQIAKMERAFEEVTQKLNTAARKREKAAKKAVIMRQGLDGQVIDLTDC